MDETAKALKACIISHKGGIPTEELDDAFYKLTGHYIPYLRLGYSSLYEYLGTIKDIRKIRNQENELVYQVSTRETAHIASMIAKQKDSTTRSRSTTTNPRFMKKLEPRENRNSKRKALNEGRWYGRSQKKSKHEGQTKSRGRKSNNDYPSYSDGEENHGDWPCDISDYDHWYDDEYSTVKIFEKSLNLDVVCDPIVNGKLLIGDDFFLQLAIRNLGRPIWRKQQNTALRSGLCMSGQTIMDCIRSLSKVQALANKVVILLGAEDIYRGHSSEKMIEDMETLLYILQSDFALSKSAITLCTLPPLGNLARGIHDSQLTALDSFNNWIRKQTMDFENADWNFANQYNLVEFFYHNSTVNDAPAYDYFQMDARMVSGTRHPYVLWNLRGRRLAMNLLRSGC